MAENPEKFKYTAQRFKINRRGFGLREEISNTLSLDYHSELVRWMRDHDHRLELSDVTFLLAKEFGFCYGVDGAIEIAYETCRKFPERTKYITTEIIHNPRVNKRLLEMGVEFLSGQYGTGKTLNDVRPEDVVILPAFGARISELERLTETGCTMVDTTCASVMNVWKRVEQYARDGVTAVIHGKYYHEETLATASRVTAYPGGQYLIVLNREEASRVCEYIREGGDAGAFLSEFRNCISEGFDPNTHLQRVGVANQTTMLSSESQEIAAMLRAAMVDRHGAGEAAERFRNFDTICSATQERQDAMVRLAEGKPDLVLVLGGYNSSNTSNLASMAARMAPAYHVSEPDCILSAEEIRHKPDGQKEEVVARGWLPAGPVVIGLTAGASTPDRIVAEAIERVCEIRGIGSPDLGFRI